ncbi:MAG: archaeosortase/exosortase family protein [Acidimicrobiia bacterium]|nr:archaeosortase/exosortase family protein [Acidimicrobiia bacterium]
MSTRNARVALRMLGVIAVAGGGFLVLQHPARHVEAEMSSGLLRVIGARGVSVVGASSSEIQVVPDGHAPFRAIVTPSCSSLASALAIGALASLAPVRRRGDRTRRMAATSAAVAIVVAGNVVRIAASLAVGLVAGRTSLILFHDWVGSMFGFSYTLGGYVLLLYLLLPSGTGPCPSPSPSSSSLPSPASSSC